MGGLTGFYPSIIFIPLVYNSCDQKVLINDWYACLQVLSKQLTVWNAYLSLLGYNLVIAPVFSFDPPMHWDRSYVGTYVSSSRLEGIMLQKFFIILYRISPKITSLCLLLFFLCSSLLSLYFVAIPVLLKLISGRLFFNV